MCFGDFAHVLRDGLYFSLARTAEDLCTCLGIHDSLGRLLVLVRLCFNQVLEPHQQIRIKVVLGLEEDLAGAGYNVNQSKIAIGSGGLWGKGFLNGTQTKLKYVPEQDTDFIFVR